MAATKAAAALALRRRIDSISAALGCDSVDVDANHVTDEWGIGQDGGECVVVAFVHRGRLYHGGGINGARA